MCRLSEGIGYNWGVQVFVRVQVVTGGAGYLKGQVMTGGAGYCEGTGCDMGAG